jgi:hypothetical protein
MSMLSPSENPCSKFFDDNANNLTKVQLLQALPDFVNWERLKASKHSPSLVDDSEALYRCVFNPIHLDVASKEISLAAITDVKDKGCSVDRLIHSTRADIISRGRAMALLHNKTHPDKPPRQLICIAMLNASKVRSILVNDTIRAFYIYDTALPENPAHADICQAISDSKNKQSARSARSRLFELISEALEFIEF